MIFNCIGKYWIVMLIDVINFENSSELFRFILQPTPPPPPKARILVSSLSIPQNLMNTEFSTNIPASIEPQELRHSIVLIRKS